MKIFLTIVTACLLSTLSIADDGFVSLFNGSNLDGWDCDPKLWKVEDGIVIGTCSGPDSLSNNSFLIWRGGKVKDFELRATVRVVGDNNSGIQYRSRELPEVAPWVITGYQCDIHPAIEHTGMTYEEKGRGIFGLNGKNVMLDPEGALWLLLEHAPVKVDVSQWNEYTIVASGNHLVHKINGQTTSELIDHDEKKRAMEGLLAIQLHRGNPNKVQVKELRIKEFSDGKLLPFEQPAGAKKLDKPRTSNPQGVGPVSPKQATAIAQTSSGPPNGEPTNAAEAAKQKANADAVVDEQYHALFEKLPPDQQAWESVLQSQLGTFYLPIHKRDKVAGRSSAWDFVSDDPKLPRVLIIGDSVSRGYTQAARTVLAGKANVHRAPANCGPTASGIKNIEVWLGDGKWDVIHFNFGIHDRNTPIADYTQRLEQLIERMKKTGAKLLWASTTPIPDDASKKQSAASIAERNEVAAELMKKHDVATDDLFAAMTPNLAAMQNPNDVHFNAKGYDFLGETVAKAIEEQLPKR